MLRIAALAALLLVPGPRIAEPIGVAAAPDGSLTVSDRKTGAVYRVDPRSGARRTLVGVVKGGTYAIAYDHRRRVHVASEARIWRVDRGRLVAVAGTGMRGYSGDGGPATAARLGAVTGMGFDGAGNLYVAEYDNRIRIVAPDGTIDTLAGNGTEGHGGDGGPAAEATLSHPHDLVVRGDGTVYVADSWNNALRRIEAGTRTITTVMKGLGAFVGLARAPNGDIYAVDGEAGTVTRIRPNGTKRMHARGLTAPWHVAIDRRGTVYVTSFIARAVWRVAPNGRVTKLVA